MSINQQKRLMNLRRDSLNALMWLAKNVFPDFILSSISAACYIKFTELGVQMTDMGLRGVFFANEAGDAME